MGPRSIPYRYEQPVRNWGVFTLVFAAVIWTFLVVFDYLKRGSPGYLSAVASLIAVALIAIGVRYIVLGGKWSLRISANGIEWKCPDFGTRSLAFDEIDHFVQSRESSGFVEASASADALWLVLKSGEPVRVPPNCVEQTTLISRLLSEHLQQQG